jgi:hypothetical protein
MAISREDFLSTTQAKSDQINAADLLGGPLTCQITDIQLTGSADQPISIFVDAHPQPWKPSKTSRRVLAACWADSDPSEWVGRWLVLYNDETVKWAGKAEGGIRCSHMSHISGEKTIMTNETRGKKAAQKVQPFYPVDAPSAKVEPTYWPDDAFEKQVPRATDAILAGDKQADEIIAALEKKALLTAGQKARLQSIKAEPPEQESEPDLNENPDPFAE